jgi:hypothetical protein
LIRGYTAELVIWYNADNHVRLEVIAGTDTFELRSVRVQCGQEEITEKVPICTASLGFRIEIRFTGLSMYYALSPDKWQAFSNMTIFHMFVLAFQADYR